jgi:hypothetical protein
MLIAASVRIKIKLKKSVFGRISKKSLKNEILALDGTKNMSYVFLKLGGVI